MKVKLESEGLEIHAEWYRWIFNMKAGIKEKRWGILREKEERVKLRGKAGRERRLDSRKRQHAVKDSPIQ